MSKPLAFDASTFTVNMDTKPMFNLSSTHEVFTQIKPLRKVPGISNDGNVKLYWTTSIKTGNVITVQEMHGTFDVETSVQYLGIGQNEFREYVETGKQFPGPETLVSVSDANMYQVAHLIISVLEAEENYIPLQEEYQVVDHLEDSIS